jgi:hypothetical protein
MKVQFNKPMVARVCATRANRAWTVMRQSKASIQLSADSYQLFQAES